MTTGLVRARSSASLYGLLERKRNAAIHHERRLRIAERRRKSQRMRDSLVHVDDVGPQIADEAPQASDARHIELMAHRQRAEAHPVRCSLLLHDFAGPRHDRHIVAALAESGSRLEHLVHRTGGELVELEDLENAHGARS